MTPDEVLRELQILEEKCPCRFVVVAGRRKAEDVKIATWNQQKQRGPAARN